MPDIILPSEPAQSPDFDYAEPRADAMIQSLRAVGYDLPMAIADLIDNSISAEAKNIWLEFFWSGQFSSIAILDDGKGMDETTLKNAMRLGSTSPLAMRDAKDLGRFGLGLKTASFSQCKSLTVGSKSPNAIVTRRWDLDYVTQCGEWRLLRTGSQRFVDQYLPDLERLTSGTVVVWEDLDRIAGDVSATSDEDQARFLHQAEEVRQHVSMVFHRFLENAKTLKIFLNNQPVKAWDPFLSSEPATQLLTDEALSIFGKKVNVRPYVLPHHSKISAQLYQEAEGPRGWNAQQGFYVYRNQRLLAAGDWLNLHGLRKEEHYKLARIMLDIPNSMDEAWEIDVKKSRATPPPGIRGKLLQIAKATRQKASGIYRHRGTRLVQGAGEVVPLWSKKVLHGQISYAISREHPLVKNLLNMGGLIRRKTEAVLALIEETIPVPMITMDVSESPDRHSKPFEGKDESVILAILQETFQSLRHSGQSRSEARLYLSTLDPFHHYPHLLASLDEEPLGEQSA